MVVQEVTHLSDAGIEVILYLTINKRFNLLSSCKDPTVCPRILVAVQIQAVINLLWSVPEADVERCVRRVDCAHNVGLDDAVYQVESFLLVRRLLGQAPVHMSHREVGESQQLVDVSFGAVISEHWIRRYLNRHLCHVADGSGY